MVWRPIIVPNFDLAVAPRQPATELPRGHIPALDAIRGLAIVAVMLYRFGGGGDGPASVVEHTWWIGLGSRGVDLFFVLSGFLITGILFDARGKEGYFRNFYARRSLRIFPLYYAALAVLLLVLPRVRISFPEAVAPAADAQAWLWLYGANVLQAARGEWCLGALNHFWSLAIEEHFYLAWPAVIYFASRQTAMRICVGLFFGSTLMRAAWLMAGGNDVAAEVLTPLRLDGLVLGGWLALAARVPGGLSWLAGRARPMLIVLGLIALAAEISGRRWLGLTYTAWAIASAALLVLVISAQQRSGLKRLGDSRLLQFFGKYSYAMYVFQLPLIYLLAPWLTAAGLANMVGNAVVGQLAYCAVLFGITIIAAWLSWQLFEKHVLKLKHYFG